MPVICSSTNVAYPVSGRDPSKINKPLRPGRKTVEEWLKFVVEHQFTLQEIEDGVAYKTLQKQYGLILFVYIMVIKYSFPYVKNLHNMVERNLTIPHKFICFTDNTVIAQRKEFRRTNIEFRQFKRHDFNGGLINYNCLVLIVI